ncbi:MAG TPA: cyclic nucleotide-binding domain-containing protein [Acidimicrobiales bacterium]|nr:cyclic nucleotide-binding domain-containing protein [Acidimicrobiales bacterium]
MAAKRNLVDLLGDVTLFSKCTKGELKTIARHAETVRLDPGVDLTTQGAEGDAFYVILDGTADVLVDGEVRNQLTSGDWFGELALLDGEPRTATVRAGDDLEVAVLGVRMFRTLLREFPDLAAQLLAGLATALRQARGS